MFGLFWIDNIKIESVFKIINVDLLGLSMLSPWAKI